jgi:hypothetical protein
MRGEVERSSRTLALAPREGVLGERHRTIKPLPATNVISLTPPTLLIPLSWSSDDLPISTVLRSPNSGYGLHAQPLEPPFAHLGPTPFGPFTDYPSPKPAIRCQMIRARVLLLRDETLQNRRDRQENDQVPDQRHQRYLQAHLLQLCRSTYMGIG